jgi:hypothetical protein
VTPRDDAAWFLARLEVYRKADDGGTPAMTSLVERADVLVRALVGEIERLEERLTDLEGVLRNIANTDDAGHARQLARLAMARIVRIAAAAAPVPAVPDDPIGRAFQRGQALIDQAGDET